MRSFDLKKAIKIARQKLKASGDRLDIERIFNNLDVVESLWEQDLKELLVDIPDFDKVVDRIKIKTRYISPP